MAVAASTEYMTERVDLVRLKELARVQSDCRRLSSAERLRYRWVSHRTGGK
jgi:hypothetical protein